MPSKPSNGNHGLSTSPADTSRQSATTQPQSLPSVYFQHAISISPQGDCLLKDIKFAAQSRLCRRDAHGLESRAAVAHCSHHASGSLSLLPMPPRFR
mmetsp:Transcript_6257/g.14159  ORF Transcript_6257/g.14159 Transcript_6257/m.14159 type:complete len:97 (-) Transcript_6257:45-335(-)